MFKQMFFGKDYLLDKILAEIQKMLKETEKMFSFAVEVLLEHHPKDVNLSGKPGLTDIYLEDQEVNRALIDIRKKLLEHLTLNPQSDITASLVLATVVVDIERIGDYTKNIIELAEIYPEKIEEDEWIAQIRELEKIILPLFARTRSAFEEGNVEMAKEVLETHHRVARQCDNLITELIKQNKLLARKAVLYVLMARYFKRVSAHLKNVASSVVNPFQRVSFKPEGEK